MERVLGLSFITQIENIDKKGDKKRAKTKYKLNLVFILITITDVINN